MRPEADIRQALATEFGSIEYRRPPYGSEIRGALEALDSEARAGRSFAVLVPSRTDTNWFHELCAPWEVRFLRGRVVFPGWRSGAPFPSAVVVMGPHARRGVIHHWDPWEPPRLFGLEAA